MVTPNGFAESKRAASGIDNVGHVHGRICGHSSQIASSEMWAKQTHSLSRQPTMAGMARRQSNPVDPNTPGGRLTKARRAAGLTQEDLAAKVGISRSQLAHMERNTEGGGRATWGAIATTLGLSLDFLLGTIARGESEIGQGPELVEEPSEIELLRFWRDLTAPGKRLLYDVLLGQLASEVGKRSPSVRIAREGNNIIVSQEIAPVRRVVGR